ncbi:hypothetical protein DSO57_1019940 [Entomophthora muscae]|uniref:Uncharacterized protein n=1 Tax=Entomophthora muscae TaxID=34485 RepID=A0ACC2S5R4_9FUNG|nr:hypothetical protein DSO57_1019940 [Entomophthora muscae]
MHTENLYFTGVYYIITIFILLVLSNREYLQYQCQRWETEQLLAASNQPLPAFTPSPRVLDQELIPASALRPSFPGVPLLQQLAQPSLTMSAATGELPLIPSTSSYDYSNLGFAYLTMLGLTEQVIPHMGVWCPWATAANYVMQMAPVIYWAFQAHPFPLTKGSPGSCLGHDSMSTLSKLVSLSPYIQLIIGALCMFVFMIAAYYTYQFFTRCTIAHNKPRPESHPSTAQVQNVNISTSNQNAYAPVNSLPSLALDRKIFPRHTKKDPQSPAKPLNSLEDLAHTVDKRFVLAYPVDVLPLAAPSWEETLVNLDFLLAWCCPHLKTIRTNQSKVATLTTSNSSEPQIHKTPSSQSNGPAEIGLKHSSPPGSVSQKFSPG